jgi:hypothetical protein
MARIRTATFFLATASLGAVPAAAATATGSIGVGATVVPACTVSTETLSATPSVTCSNLGGGQVAIRTAPASGSTAPAPGSADPLQGRDATRGDGTRYVTITY